jgi:CHAT domain-containing protein/tetratricopeptide (TPR) repeat protein
VRRPAEEADAHAEAALNALLNAPNWDETRAVLEGEQSMLLSDAAVARLQAAVEDARKSGAGEREVLLELRLGLLQGARARGIEIAWPEFLARVQERQVAANALGQVLIPWFNIASPREARRFLETHTELLQAEADMLFDPLLTQYAGQAPAVQSLATHRALLRAARTRGGTEAAIRDAYVDVQGGLALDVPAWLEEIEEQAEALETQQTAQAALARADLWRQALVRAGQQADVAPETGAAMQQSLWEALYAVEAADPSATQEPGIAALAASLTVYTRERYPIQWAMTQSNLGRMYIDRAQGDRSENVERALECLTGALQVYTPEQYPLQWATTQGNLGDAYRVRLAGDQAENLEQALACFERALQVYTREAFPAQWANLQNNLGVAYGERIRGDRSNNQERAIACYTAALDVYTRDEVPLQWAMTRNNLGIAYRNRIKGDAAENQEQALACYTDALAVRTREAMPNDWAVTQNNLGRLYIDRIRGNRAENLEQAIASLQAALEVRTRGAMPFQWALTQNNLGDAYLSRIQGERAERVEQALACYQSALEVYTREAAPSDWAATQRNLGGAYAERIRGDRAENLERAIACYTAALEAYTPEGNPMLWAQTQGELAAAYVNRIRGDRSDNVEQALAHYGDALTVLTPEALPGDWATTQVNLGNAYLERIAGDHAANIEQAIGCYVDALAVRSREADPFEWAKIQGNLGAAYFQRVRGDRSENLEQALARFASALTISTRDALPEAWASLRFNQGTAFTDRIQGERTDNVEQALASFDDALQVYTLQAYPVEWARAQIGRGSAYRARLRGARAENLEQALACDQAALEVYTRDAFPADWALAQNNLGITYADRIQGDRAENLERAIACYQVALEVRTQGALPLGWAATTMNLGAVYADRIQGDRAENIERAIACYNDALGVYTRNAVPQRWAQVQNNLGSAYAERMLGEQGENIDRAILCYQAALEVHTHDGAPRDWARLQNNLGDAYLARIRGDRTENQGRALRHFQAAQEVYTRDAFPLDWALARRNEGRIYIQRATSERRSNFEQALSCYADALQVYTRDAQPREWASTQALLGNVYQDQVRAGLADDPGVASEHAVVCYRAALEVRSRDASPLEFRRASIQLAEAEAQRGRWDAAHAAYEDAQEAEESLLALTAGARGRDVILQLREGREWGARDAFTLAQLGQLEKALLAVERGRTHGIAAMRTLRSADPARITDEGRRTRFLQAQSRLIDAQTAINRPRQDDVPEEQRRQADLALAATLRSAQADLDTAVAEIRAASDPADFLRDDLDMAAIWRAAVRGPVGHGLIYLLATPWGGMALAALRTNPATGAEQRVASLALPDLTSDLVSDLIQAELSELDGRVIGGFGHAQEGRGFSFIDHNWPGATFAEKAAKLHDACAAAGRESTLDRASQEILRYPTVAAIAARPLGPTEYAQLDPTFEFAYLQHELRRCLPVLGQVALRPVVAWLRGQGVVSASFIPTGALATFPLLAVPLSDVRDPADASDWQTVEDALAASVAPSARALLASGSAITGRDGVATLGDPRPTHQELQWGEAEALMLAKLGGNAYRVRIHEQATREWLLEALRTAEVVDACCHGEFDPLDFLRSRLLLAKGGRLTLGEMLGGETHMEGLRLLILSACQTAILDLRGARDEVRSLAAGMLQAGAHAVLGAQWSVDDKATFLLMTRFAQEWLPIRDREAPAAALARAKRWLRGVTTRELREWEAQAQGLPSGITAPAGELMATRGGGMRYGSVEAAGRSAATAPVHADDARPFADPIYWSAFQITGW